MLEKKCSGATVLGGRLVCLWAKLAFAPLPFPHPSLSGNRSQWENHSEGLCKKSAGVSHRLSTKCYSRGRESVERTCTRRSSREQVGMKGRDRWTTGSPINRTLVEAEGLLWREVAAGAAGSAGRQQAALSRKTGSSNIPNLHLSVSAWVANTA